MRHFFILHIIVLVWGFTPVLGRFISLSTWQLVWWRMLMIWPLMIGYIYLKKTFKPTKQQVLKMLLFGVLISFHWLCFYGAIKISNISVTMAAYSSATLFTSLIEPILYKRKIYPYELLLGILIIIGISVIFSVSFEYLWGILLGLVAAFLASLFSVLNSLLAKEVPSIIITAYEMLFGWLVLTLYLLFGNQFTSDFFIVSASNWVGLAILAYVCTAIPFIISIDLTKHISPYTINLTVNLESIYGIILAILIYQENKYLSPKFYLGVLIILTAIFLNAWLKKISEKRSVKRSIQQ